MTIWYVRPSGGTYGTEDGSSYDNAWDGFANIDWSVSGIVSGDTLYVCGDFSAETLTPAGGAQGTAESKITIRGDYPGDPGTISTDGANCISVTNKSWFTFKRLSLSAIGGSSTINLGGGGGNLRFDEIIITNGFNGFTLASGDGVTHSNLTITGCTIQDCTNYGMRWWVSALGATSTLTDVLVTGNTIKDCTRSGILFGTASDADAASIMTRITITSNNISGNGRNVETGDHGRLGIDLNHGHATLAEGQDVTITDNGLSGNGSGTWGGGIRVVGFGSSTSDYGKVDILRNYMDGNDGEVSGIDIAYCQYARISRNTCNNNVPFDDGIVGNSWPNISDASGIKVGVGNEDVKVFRNECSGNVGSSAEDSGAGIIVLQNTRVTISANRGAGNKDGIRIAGGDSTALAIAANSFMRCAEDGLRIAVAQTDASIQSNNLTGASTNTGYKVSGVAGSSLTEDYNNFYGFQSETQNHTLGSNDIEQDDLEDINLRPRNTALIGQGITVAVVSEDYDGLVYASPPSVGHLEMRHYMAGGLPLPNDKAVPSISGRARGFLRAARKR